MKNISKIFHKIFPSTVWEVKLEEPSQESGYSKHRIILGRFATVNTVKKYLMKMEMENGLPRYYKQDVNPPYLHYIKKLQVRNK